MLVTDKLFQPSSHVKILFIVTHEADKCPWQVYPASNILVMLKPTLVEHVSSTPLWSMLLSLLTNIRLGLEKDAMYKRSSLSGFVVC